jgi:hypothetical protein
MCRLIIDNPVAFFDPNRYLKRKWVASPVYFATNVLPIKLEGWSSEELRKAMHKASERETSQWTLIALPRLSVGAEVLTLETATRLSAAMRLANAFWQWDPTDPTYQEFARFSLRQMNNKWEVWAA